ncbi:MAG: hypothetical protein Q9187_007100 [Circinaria calcarea]
MQIDSPSFQSLRKHALNTLKNSRSVRTNQFEVNARLEGLVEKFGILNRDELAHALQTRLQELETKALKQAPEILSLLLELSDNPVQNSRVERLNQVERPSSPAQLTWADILAEDPLDNSEGIWDTIDYADESSEDEVTTPDLDSGSEDKGSVSSQEEGESLSLEGVGALPIEFAPLDEIARAQFWKEDYNDEEAHGENNTQVDSQCSTTYITETQVIREVLFMLLGLPSKVYSSDTRGYLVASTRYGIRHASMDALQNSLKCFASLGDHLKTIREYVQRRETVALVQTFQAMLEMRLRDIENLIAKIQESIINPCKGETVTLLSLLSTLSELQNAMLPLSNIAGTVVVRCREEDGNPFAILEELFNVIVFREAIGDVDTSQLAAEIFFPCFNVYLKPIRAWMERGKLHSNDHTVFVKKNLKDLPLTSLWSDQYVLLYDHEGNLHAPRFLHLAAKKIFKTGKSVIFLKRLGQLPDYEQETSASESPLNYSTVCSTTTQGLCSFTDLFSMALNEWITIRHHSSSLRLREVLGSHCGLWSSLNALDSVYFSPDGAIRGQIASSIFRRIDEGRRTWNDRFILTGIFHEKLAKIDCVDTRRLAIRSVSENRSSKQSNHRSVKALSSILINYTVPWAVANILKPESFATYQRVFALLLQVERAQQLLYRRPLIRWIALGAKDDKAIYHLILSLQHRLLWFVNTLQTYLTTIVLPQSSADMRQQMQKAEDLDEMIDLHQRYILHLQDQCLLSERLASVHQAIISLLDLTVLFADTSASYAAKIPTDTRPEIARRKSSTRLVLRTQRRNSLDAFSSEDTDAEQVVGSLKKQHAYQEEGSHLAQLRKLSMTFSQLLGSIHAGLQEAIRTGKEACWEILLDDLALGLGRG